MAARQQNSRGRISAHVRRGLLSFRFDNTLWIRWQLKNPRLLTLIQERQQQDLAIWEFKRVVVDEALVFVNLAKDGGAVFCCFPTPSKQARQSGSHHTRT